MSQKILVHEDEVDVDGEAHKVSVYRYPGGRFYAQTSFSETDIIVTDGTSSDEALGKHCHVLPLAVMSRKAIPGYGRGAS